MNSVNQGIGKAMEKVNAAAQEANAKAEAEGKPLTEEEKEKQAQALDALKGLGGMFSGAVEMAKKEMQAEVEAKAAAEARTTPSGTWAVTTSSSRRWTR